MAAMRKTQQFCTLRERGHAIETCPGCSCSKRAFFFLYLKRNTAPAIKGQYIQLSTTPVMYVTMNMPPSKVTFDFIEPMWRHIWFGIRVHRAGYNNSQ